MSFTIITVITYFRPKIRMEAKQQLSAWLHAKNRDYKQGVTLLKSLAVPVEHPGFFNVAKPSKIHHSLLLRILSEYARINNIKPAPAREEPVVAKAVVQIRQAEGVQGNQVPVSHGSARPRIDKNPVVRYKDLPANLQVLFDENGKLQGEIKSLHARLKLLKDDPQAKDQRAGLARQIVSRQKRNRANWDTIDTWWLSRNVQEDPIEQARREALDKDKRIKANLNYIRRYHGKEKNEAEVNLRMQELDKWGVSYEKLIR